MAIYRIQASLQDTDGLSKDRYVNTYYVASPTPLDDEPTMLASVNAAVAAFYTGMEPYLASCLSGPLHSVKAYNMMLPPNARPPIAPLLFSLAPNGASLPGEVALAITLEATPVAGIAPQSTRGRIYLGPLSKTDEEVPTPTTAHSRPTDALLSAAQEKMIILINAIKAVQPSLRLVIASTVHAKVKYAVGARQAYEVVNVSVDNAWDTQRSRGNAPTARYRQVVNPTAGFTYSW